MLVINDETIKALNTISPFLQEENVMIMMSKDEFQSYLNWKETYEIESNLGLNAHLIQSSKTPREERILMNEVNWDEV